MSEMGDTHACRTVVGLSLLAPDVPISLRVPGALRRWAARNERNGDSHACRTVVGLSLLAPDVPISLRVPGALRRWAARNERNGDTHTCRTVVGLSLLAPDVPISLRVPGALRRWAARNELPFRWRGSEKGAGLFAGGGAQGEGLGDEVAEGVGEVGAAAVFFVEVAGGGAGGIGGPGDFFEVADEFFAGGVDEEAGFAQFVAEAGVDAIDTVADEGVDGGEVIRRLDETFVHMEEFANLGPIGSRAGGAALVAAGVAVNAELQGRVTEMDQLRIRGDALDQFAAGFFGGGVGANDDFFEDVDVFVDFLQEEHAHGVDVEIEGPDE